MGVLLFVVVAAYFLIRPKSVNPSADAQTVIQNAPVNPADTGQLVAGAEQEVHLDLNTGKVIESAVVIGTGVAAGLATAAGTAVESGTFIALSATAWTGIGAAIAGVVALVFALRSDTHLFADQLVQKYENPFGDYVIQIIGHETDEFNRQALSKADANAYFQAVRTAWEKYQDVMHQLMARSTDWLIVSKQSLNNLDNQYRDEVLPNGKRLDVGMGGVYPNGFMTQWLAWMEARTVDAQL
jgi:hypothetical protein